MTQFVPGDLIQTDLQGGTTLYRELSLDLLLVPDISKLITGRLTIGAIGIVISNVKGAHGEQLLVMDCAHGRIGWCFTTYVKGV
jgi:hypothetical protein